MSTLRKTRILLALAVLVTIMTSGAYALFYAVIKEKARIAEEVGLRANDIESKQGKLSLSLAVLKDRTPDIEALNAAFVMEDDIVFFVQSIEALGSRSGTTLKIESLDPRIGGKDVNPTLNFRLAASGKFNQTMYLLKLLETFPAKIEWGEVRLSRTDIAVSPEDEKGKSVPLPSWELRIAGSILNFIHE